MSDQEKRIQEIMERTESGTKNEWFVPKNAKQIVFNEQDHPLIVARCEDAEDAQFIAHARQDIPYLLDLIESLQRERDERVSTPGEISDGYHTFNELYHHRAVLFSVICNEHPKIAWKSLHHHIGGQPMYEGMFIVGINTSDGQATYHYDVDPYWGMFDVPVLEYAPEWDGHTPS